MRIALVSEGTYPFAIGGVSTWCDQLIRGFPEYRWEMVALTVDGRERSLWERPENLDRIHRIPLWSDTKRSDPKWSDPKRGGPQPGGARRPGSGFASAYEALLTAMLEQGDPRSHNSMVARSRFLLALRGIFEYGSGGGNLGTALTSNAAVTQLVTVWRETCRTELTLADAVETANLFAHMLRPLAAPPVRSDIVHASMNGLSMLAAMAAKWRYGTPVLMSEHGVYLRERYLAYLDETASLPVRAMMLGFFRALAGAGYLIADALAPHSSYNRRWQLRNGADPDRMWTMYNGVEPTEFPVAETEPERPTIVFMGRINPLKDILTLIRAFAHVLTRVPEARLRIFGSTTPSDEAYGQSCRQLIDDLGLSNAVTMEGAVDSPVNAYHAATIVALTSISEGFPMTVVEAMACGRPIVCTNVGGVSEAVADAGIVVAARDHVAVAQACVTMLTDHELRGRMAKAARSRVLRLFSLDESLEAYRRIYDHLSEHHTNGSNVTPPLPQQTHPLVVPLPPYGPRRAYQPRALGRVRIEAALTDGAEARVGAGIEPGVGKGIGVGRTTGVGKGISVGRRTGVGKSTGVGRRVGEIR
jgi:glycosyltransferase involved in cell wall biosynthesis